MKIKKLLFIIQRFGNDVDGGAELYCRWFAEKLAPIYDITVATTCAKNYITWANEYQPGEFVQNSFRVLRFKSQKERDINAFNTFTQTLLNNPRSFNQMEEWLVEQGPYSPELLEYIADNHPYYDLLIFFTYLYYPTVKGLKLAPEKSILIPTAHDEPVAKLPIFRDVFEKNFDVQNQPRILISTGISIPSSNIDKEMIKKKYDIPNNYILYLGRVEAGKGCQELIEFFDFYHKHYNQSIDLVLAGRNHMRTSSHPQIHFTDFVPDEEVKPIIEGSYAVVVPSIYESLSILLLQAMKLGRPVIANGHSSVLKEHCLLSNAGLFYHSLEEFCAILELFKNRSDIHATLGTNGKSYINKYYSWEQLILRFQAFTANL